MTGVTHQCDEMVDSDEFVSPTAVSFIWRLTALQTQFKLFLPFLIETTLGTGNCLLASASWIATEPGSPADANCESSS